MSRKASNMTQLFVSEPACVNLTANSTAAMSVGLAVIDDAL